MPDTVHACFGGYMWISKTAQDRVFNLIHRLPSSTWQVILLGWLALAGLWGQPACAQTEAGPFAGGQRRPIW